VINLVALRSAILDLVTSGAVLLFVFLSSEVNAARFFSAEYVPVVVALAGAAVVYIRRYRSEINKLK
jgi:hypothetical protein